jgi:hypothetical protein
MPRATNLVPVRPDFRSSENRKLAPFYTPTLREYGTLSALTMTRTCAKGYNDGTGAGCSMSFKKS